MNVEIYGLLSGVNETRFLIQTNSCEYKCALNQSLFNSKQKHNYDNCRFECKELEDWSSFKDVYMWNSSTCDCKCNKACKIDEYLDTKNCSRKERLFGKLLSACKDEILNKTKTSVNHKKVTYRKVYCLLFTMFLVIISLLSLIVISNSCYDYFENIIQNKKKYYQNIFIKTTAAIN